MEDKSKDMQIIFNALSERNKDIVILVAKSVKVAQEVTEQSNQTLYKKTEKEKMR